MADKDLELDVNQAKGSKMTNILLITLIVLVLAVGGVGAFMFMGDKDGGADDGSKSASSQKIENRDPLLYITLVPEFVINFGPDSEVRYLQIDVQAASRQQSALDAMNLYMPVIRNDVLVLLSGQTFADLKTRSGKELIQRRILNTINTIVNSVLAKKDGESKNEKDTNNQAENKVEIDPNTIVEGPIENIYFLSFIMQ